MPSTWNVRATGGPQAIDLDEVRRALEILVDSNHWVELRGLPSGRSRVVKGSDIDGLVKAAEDLADNRNTYYCLNPLRGHFEGRGGRKDDVVKRRWILVDIDPVKPDVESPATDAEKEEARQVADKVIDYLLSKHWGDPVYIDSGNGWHLLYRVDLPNDNHAHAIIRAALYHLAEKFDTDKAKVDRSVHNPARIAKLPGTWARKGEPSKVRPFRPCRLIDVPEFMTIIRAEQIQSLTQEVKTEPKQEPTPIHETNGFKVHANSDYRAYAKAALESEMSRVKRAAPGPKEGRNNALNRAGYSMGQCVGAGWILRQEVVASLRMAAIIAGLPEEEIDNTLPRAVEDGYKVPRVAPKETKKEEKPKVDLGASILIRANSVTPRHVEWLWPGRIPLGKLTTFAGVGGLGKTFVLCDITARITRGAPWPDSDGECPEPGQVLFITGEDELDDTIVPRLIECGADLSKVVFLKTEIQDAFTLKDLDTLDAAIKQAGPSVRFVAIDPPTAFLGDVNDHKNAELRGLLSPLKSWAGKHRIAVVFNTHVTKPQASKVDAMMRVMGSVAWVNAVRAAFMFAVDPDDAERCLFVPMKMNVGKRRKGLAYQLQITDTLARIEWKGEVDTTADEAMNKQKKETKGSLASEWLVDRFREKLEWESDELFRAAKNDGLSRDSIFEAKRILDLPRARLHVGCDGSRRYAWWVPADWPTLSVSTNATVPQCHSVDESAF